ncbi:RES domain-containing protein [Agrobacterium vitis]|uniref:RES domain-containing protein n=1 Tax=Agrobacterium vitis TaxID=373 RepID=UPI00307FAE73
MEFGAWIRSRRPLCPADTTRSCGSAIWAEWDCLWRRIARINRKIPASWKLSDVVISARYKGILFPSLRHAGGTNLVVFSADLNIDGRPDGQRNSPALPRLPHVFCSVASIQASGCSLPT